MLYQRHFWYGVTQGSHAAAESGHTVTIANEKSISVDGLVFTFSVTGAGNVKLNDGAGHTKAYAKDDTTLIVRDIASVAGYYTTATVAVTKITIGDGESDVKGTADTMKDYAGTYSFTCTPTGHYYCSTTEPSAVADLASMSQSGISVVVTVSNVGGVSVTTNSSFFVSVRGDNSIHDGSESGSFTWA